MSAAGRCRSQYDVRRQRGERWRGRRGRPAAGRRRRHAPTRSQRHPVERAGWCGRHAAGWRGRGGRRGRRRWPLPRRRHRDHPVRDDRRQPGQPRSGRLGRRRRELGGRGGRRRPDGPTGPPARTARAVKLVPPTAAGSTNYPRGAGQHDRGDQHRRRPIPATLPMRSTRPVRTTCSAPAAPAGWSNRRHLRPLSATSSTSPTPGWPRWATTAGRPRPWPCSPAAPPSATGIAIAGITTDQRGFPLTRPPDIGAFQTQPLVVVNTTSDGDGSLAAAISTFAQAVNLADASARRDDHLRPDRLRGATDDHPDGRPARAERHRRAADDHRPGRGRDHQRRRKEPRLPGGQRRDRLALRPDHHRRLGLGTAAAW